jgi:hypothetical protein
MDVQTIKQNAARSAWGYQVQAENFGQEAKMDTAKGYEGLFSPLIGGAGQFADKRAKYQEQGDNWKKPLAGFGGADPWYG